MRKEQDKQKTSHSSSRSTSSSKTRNKDGSARAPITTTDTTDATIMSGSRNNGMRTKSTSPAPSQQRPRSIRRRPQRRPTTTTGGLFKTGSLFWTLVAFCALFLMLNILLHSRLQDLNQLQHQHQSPRPEEQHQQQQQQQNIDSNEKLGTPREQDAQILQINNRIKPTRPPDYPRRRQPIHVEDHPQPFFTVPEEAAATSNANENTNATMHLSKEMIDMRKLTATLPFDNPDGGVWKQGWDVSPRNVSVDDPLTVFVVPHSHNDPGWLKTFDQYFRTQTIHIISSIVDALEDNPDRRFIWAEISYFSWWWQEMSLDVRQRALRLLERGQFEFVTGGWVMPDEANSHIYALQVQMQEGHDWIRQNLGPQYVPKYGWSIDPFGYSPTMPYVLKKFGFEGILIQRVHYAVKKELAKRKHLEFYWRQTWDEEGTYDMFTHLMPFYSYDIPHTCGPDPAVCCQFDYARSPFGKMGKCPWKLDPVAIDDRNVAARAHLILDQYLKKASLYRGNAVLIPLGDDFRYQTRKEAEDQFKNYEAIMNYVNNNIPGVRMQFGTLREYFEKIKGTFEPPILKGSFFTYSDVNEDYWSGYFTSRVFDKALDRQLERVLYAAESLGAQPSNLTEARRQLSLFQHHDGVTGTAKTPVVEDYAKRLYESIVSTQKWILEAMKARDASVREHEKLAPCWQADIPRGYTQDLCSEHGEAFVLNPLDDSQTCGAQTIAGKTIAAVTLPCEQPGAVEGSSNVFQFDPATGMMISPIQEKWMLWKVKKGGAYLFFPDKLEMYDMNGVNVTQGGWVVETPNWKRTLIERPSPGNTTVVDFVYQVNLQIDNQEWFVQFKTNVKNGGIFHTDLNGFNFDTHYFRSDLPIQSQVFPMPTHASIQDNRTRFTVLSEHAQGTASLGEGTIDVFLDRRLRQDDARGLGQGVRDNVITRTRLRVVLEHDTLATTNNGIVEFQITPFCRTEWNKLNHPLEVYGQHVKEYIRPPQPPSAPERISRTVNHVAANPIQQPLAQKVVANKAIMQASKFKMEKRHFQEGNHVDNPESNLASSHAFGTNVSAAQNNVHLYHPHGLYHPGAAAGI